MNASLLVSSPVLQGLRQLSRRAWWLHALLIGQLALLPCPLSRGVWVDLDTEGDELPDSGYEDGVADASIEGSPTLAEPDADGDGLSDSEEAALGSDPCNPDSDYDGLTDADEARLTGTHPTSADSDGDGMTDYNAFYGNSAVDTLWAGQGSTPYDWDGDGLHDPFDPDPFSAQNIGDADGDHVPDPEDSHPLDPMLWCDGNGNGVNDDAEAAGADFDADGVSDATDSHPADPALDNDWNANGTDDEHEDGDGDGVSNLQDSHPTANTLWCDWNGNGVNDDAEAAVAAGNSILGPSEPAVFNTLNPADAVLKDRDGDGYADGRDTHPDDSGLWNDHHGNGLNDDAEAPPDTDRDGVPDARDAAPTDHDNDGLSDAEEWIRGTNAAEADSDGDGLGDGEEVHLATDPLRVDSDGDGLTDSEEVLAYHSDALAPTAIAESESFAASAPAEASLLTATALRVSQILPAAGAEIRQRRVEHPDGGGLAFPSRSAQKNKSDLTKTLLLACAGGTPIVGLSARMTGANAAHFRLGGLSGAELTPGMERELTVSFVAPLPANQVCTATLTLHAGPEARPLFALQLRSVVSTGLWLTHDEHFFADYTDTDLDGIPDLVEEMYAPLQVTATGDLDGDGVNNLDQYLAGRNLRDRAKGNDVDGDGLTNATEDAWNAAYPGKLNKYYFADAYADPDGDGLLTIEELNCLWGSDKDPQAVATNPFVAGSPSPSVSKTATYKTAGRKPPKTPPAAGAAQIPSGPLPGRCSRYAAWMNDGLLRRACHETALANGGRLPVDFFAIERLVHAANAALQNTQGSDHLPRGYLAWLARQTPAILVPAPAPGVPADREVGQLAALCWPDAADPDADTLPTVWEAAHELNWRDGADSHLEQAIAALNRQTAALNDQNPVHLAEQEALLKVRDRLTAAASTWPVTVYPTAGGSRSTLIVPVYDVAEVAFPAALKASPAMTWASRRELWLGRQVEALHWQVLSRLDPDHDGLMNIDEHRHCLNPRLPDYNATRERDTDGDGFTDAMELATGTDHLKKTSKPVYTIEILTPVAERSVTALQTLVQPLRLQTVLKGSKGGTWPVGGQTLSVSAPDNHTLLAWEETGRGLRWQPKVVSAGVTNAQGIACLQVHPGWKGPTLNLTLKSTPGPGCPAGVRAATVTCQLKVSPPELDKDADGMQDDWESRPATQGQPAHGLAAASALDAEAGPQHFGYHPSTPAERLPEVVLSLLNEWKAAEVDLGYLPEHPATTATLTSLAVPTTADATQAARHKILALIDPDHDGWSNRVEFENGSHPRVPDNPATAARDTDGDGVADVLEVEKGTNPHDAGSVPLANLADAGLQVVWGDGQKAAPGSLAPQPVVVQLVNANGALFKRAALKASCLGGHFALPAAVERNVQWQANELPLVTDGQGKAVFHFWSPVDTASEWQVRIALTAHPAVEARVQIHNAGTGVSGGISGGGTGGGPGAGDRRPNAGDSPGFNNSHAPFIIRFVDWKSGTVSNERSDSGGSFPGSGGKSYKASKQGMRWELGGVGAPGKIPDGTPFEESIGSHTAESAQAWMNEWNRAAPEAYTVKRHVAQWIEGATDNGIYTESYWVQNGTEHLQSRSLKQSFGGEEDYHSYMNAPHADEYEVGGGSWVEVLAVYPEEEDPGSVGKEPQGQPKATTKHDYQQQVPRTFSSLATPVDTSRQRITAPIAMLNALGATIRLEDKRLPNGQRRLANGEHDWDGIAASAALQLNKTAPGEAGEPPAYSGSRSEGKVVIAWDSDYPVSLSEKSREAWLKRFLVLITRTDGTDSLQPLSDYLSLTSAGDSAPIELNPGLLNDQTTPETSVTLRLLPIDLAIDANRDGTIDQGETASEDRPFRFWVNNDDDPESNSTEADEVSPPSSPDWSRDGIEGVRDLEDFTRLQITVPGNIVGKLKFGTVKVGFKWNAGTAPRVRIYRTPENDGSRDYLRYIGRASVQCSGLFKEHVADVSDDSIAYLPASSWESVLSESGKLNLLFEGCKTGTGKLILVIKTDSSSPYVEGPGAWLKLMEAKNMIHREQVSPVEPGDVIDPWESRKHIQILLSSRLSGFDPDPDEAKQVIVHVHGWRMTNVEAETWAQTNFKRLWHVGYKGRMAAFFWPTYNAETSPIAGGRMTYNESEYRAWLSGPALAAFVNSLPNTHARYLTAHSMGNVVVGSAFRAKMAFVIRYAMFNSAMSAMAYDGMQVQFPDRVSPDTHADPATNFYGLSNKLNPITYHPDGPETAIINFYLANDFALRSWDVNHALNKPNSPVANLGTPLYAYVPSKEVLSINETRLYKYLSLSSLNVHNVKELSEALAFVTKSRSHAAGRVPNVAGSVSSNVPLADYGENDSEHSAEWVWSIQDMYPCFEELMRRFQLPTIPD